MKKKTLPVAQYVVLGLLFFAACAYQVRATIAAFPGFLDRGVAKWPFIPGYSHGEPTAAFVGPEAYKAGVRENDVVTGVNGQPFTGLAVFGEAMAQAKPGDTLEITLRTPGSNTERTAKIPLTTPSRTINWAGRGRHHAQGRSASFQYSAGILGGLRAPARHLCLVVNRSSVGTL